MYKQEESILFNNILNRVYFNDKDNFNLELIINGKCDLKCKYCYINKFQDKILPEELHKDEKLIFDNIDYLLNWLDKKNYIPNTLMLFSGEVLSQDLGWDVLKRSIKFYEGRNLGNIVIPSNMNFVNHDEKLKLFDSLYNQSLTNNTNLVLSASIDGYYCDSNRPFKIHEERDYDKIFSFCTKYYYKYHPMIYYDEIENWTKNFLWFQEMFYKYKVPWDSVYLLEVRNEGWTVEKIAIFYDFISFVVEWTYNKIVNDLKLDFWDTIFKTKAFNLFSCLFTSSKGLGCSIQSNLHVRCADLKIFPCHRLAYKYFNLGYFDKTNDNIVGINPSLMVGIHSSESSTYPYCQNCIIKHLCTGQCLGSMFETTGDMFTPIQSVCMLEHAKTKSILSTLDRLGVLQSILPKIKKKKKNSIFMIMEK